MIKLDLNEVSSSATIPAGDYTVSVSHAEVRDTKAGTGQYINLMFQVMEGPYEGFSIFELYNFDNPNPTAVRLALSKLKQLMEAAGEDNFQINDVNDLVGYVVSATVGIRPATDEFEEKNIIKSVSKCKKPLSETPSAALSGVGSVDPQAADSFESI